MNDVEELVKLTCGQEKAMECFSNYGIELIPNAAGFYSADHIIIFLSKHKHFIQDLYLLQRRLCDLTIGKEKWKIIKTRRVEQFKLWKMEMKDQHRREEQEQQQQSQQQPTATVYPLAKSSNSFRNINDNSDNNDSATTPKERRSFFCFSIGFFRRDKKKKELSDYKVENEEYQEVLDSVLHFYYLRYHPINTDDIPAEAPRIKELKKIGSTYTIPTARVERPSLDALNFVDEDFCMVDTTPEAERIKGMNESNERISYTGAMKSPLNKLRSSPLRKEIRTVKTREVALSGRSEQFAGSAKSKRGTEVSISVPGEIVDA